jgi:predicted metalloendopeptidase
MDEGGIEQRGAAALRPYLDQIAAAQTRGRPDRLFAKPGFPSPVGVGITPDPADPTHYVVGTGQGGSACRTAIITCARAPSSTPIAPPTAPT